MDILVHTELSEESLAANVPSYLGVAEVPSRLLLYSYHDILEARAVSSIQIPIILNEEDEHKKLKRAIELVHLDNELLIAAELGDEHMLRLLIEHGVNIETIDHIGRTALHFAVSSGNEEAVAVLLAAGADPNAKDNLGMSALSLCLMRRPSLRLARLLMDHGAHIVPRARPMDTGLFLQFVMMCIPTREEEKILRLLVEKGAMVNDPEAPGGRQALHFAAMSNNVHLINILVELGANLYDLNHRNETPKQARRNTRPSQSRKLLGSYSAIGLYENLTGLGI
ncbi:hypothetical protein PYW08_005113 [Mythimna loreyi]|uniref:Uncharacterized protein n=1 Tax=Mythimna loreyi TaxID=667449 RepID=A0ACC2QF47_9NEOP|nr:hypothetical protein PYW08_005113 [Mythimna loreyi]